MVDVVVANGRFRGGGMKICPDAEPDDGLFDVLTIGDVTKRDLVVTMPKIYRGTHLPHPKGELLRGRTVRARSPGVNCDPRLTFCPHLVRASRRIPQRASVAPPCATRAR